MADRPVRALFQGLAAGGADRRVGADLGATVGAIESQFYPTDRAGQVILGDGGAALGTEWLAAGAAGILAGLDAGAASGAVLLERDAALRAALHVRRERRTALRATELDLGAAAGANGVVLADGRAAGGTQGLAAGGTFGQPQAHVDAAGGAGPGGVKAAVGTGGFLLFEEQVTLGADALPALGAGAHLAGKAGRAGGAAQQDEAGCRGKDGGRGAALQAPLGAAFEAGGCAIEDACLALGAAKHEQQVALGAEPGAGRDGEIAAGAGEAQRQPAFRADLVLVVAVQGVAAAGAVELAAGRADAVVVRDAGATAGAAQGVGALGDGVAREQD